MAAALPTFFHSHPLFQFNPILAFALARQRLSQPTLVLPKNGLIAGRRRTMSGHASRGALTIDDVNPKVREAQYAVRGELAVRAEKYRKQLTQDRPATPSSEGDEKLPFDTVISANIGNPQQLDQKPLTFLRQVASLCENPLLLEHEKVLVEQLGYKQDVIDRARQLLGDVKSVGAYSQSQGAPGIRESVARFIEQRDGHPSDPDSIYLTAGASAAVNALFELICASSKTGVLVPIPQYPLYTATLALRGAHCVRYNLDESEHWSTDLSVIKESLKNARDQGIDVKAIVVINPGNPTGMSLSQDDMQSILGLAADEKLVVIADEVYQTNVFSGTFCSFKKQLRDLQAGNGGAERFGHVELASLHSISKGMVGECGHRGGYMEVVGFDDEVVAQLYKFLSISLCPPIVGQCMVECMVNPPRKGDPSYALYREEYDGIFHGLHSRAMALYEAFQQMEGVECQKPQGSMYLFPTIHIPEKAAQKGEKEGRAPDELYISRLLDATGICMVPGGGFGQKEGSFHFRTTFLAPGTDWVSRITKFHEKFMDEYR